MRPVLVRPDRLGSDGGRTSPVGGLGEGHGEEEVGRVELGREKQGSPIWDTD